jgi:hypothetical protein
MHALSPNSEFPAAVSDLRPACDCPVILALVEPHVPDIQWHPGWAAPHGG